MHINPNFVEKLKSWLNKPYVANGGVIILQLAIPQFVIQRDA